MVGLIVAKKYGINFTNARDPHISDIDPQSVKIVNLGPPVSK